MELFEFRGEDITEGEGGGIIRRIITKGAGYSKPNEGAAVEGTHTNIIIIIKKEQGYSKLRLTVQATSSHTFLGLFPLQCVWRAAVRARSLTRGS